MEDDLSTKVAIWIPRVTQGRPQTEGQKLCTSAHLKFGWGHSEEAMLDFEKAIALYSSQDVCPKDLGTALIGCADIHLVFGRFEEAMNNFLKAIELFRTDDSCGHALARAL